MSSPALASSDELWCVLLAAGESRRLGYPKQLVRDPVRPLILRAVDAAQAVAPDRLLVVLGAHSLRLRTLLSRNYGGMRIVNNAHWQDGIASSLRAGVGAVPRQASGVLIVLTDQPGVNASSLGRLTAAWRRHPSRAVAAGYGNGPGVPAILPRRLLRGLRELQGDMGAKAVLSEGGSNTLLVDMPEAAFDVDTSEDLSRLTYGSSSSDFSRSFYPRPLRRFPPVSLSSPRGRLGSVLSSRSEHAASTRR